MSNFGNTPIKGEGMAVDYGQPAGYVPTKPKVETTYVERRVPKHLEDKMHELIDKFLRDHGYDPEEI
jgi:hypothetical protein